MKYITLDEIKSFLNIEGDDEDSYLTKTVNRAEVMIESRVGDLLEREVSEFLDIKKGRKMYFLREVPSIGDLISAKSFFNNEEAGDYPSTVFLYDTYIKMNVAPSYSRNQGLKVTYKAGYFSAENIPNDIKILLFEMVETIRNQDELKEQRTGAKSEKIGQYSVSYDTDHVKSVLESSIYPENAADILSKYAKDTLKFS